MNQSLSNLQARLIHFVDVHFHERQFMVRGRGKMVAVTVTQREQVIAAIAAAGFFVWSACATIGMALSSNGLVHAAMAEHSLHGAIQQAQAKMQSLESQSQAMIAQMQAQMAQMQAQRDDAVAQANQKIAADQAQVKALTQQVETSIDSVQNIIKSTGLDPNQLAASPPAQPVPKDLTASGPDHTPAASAMDQKRTDLMQDVGKLQELNAVLQHLPIVAPVANVDISSPFGYRPSPFTGAREFHVGIDIRGPIGTPVYATAPGVVSFAGVSTGYGYLVEIDHGYGLTTRYSHLDKIQVKVGEVISLHQQIGLLGNTGWSTGPHLLYETRYEGKPLDPLHFIKVYH
ncbi:MAG: hypothetical protein B7Z75_02025 [Acidocella sp. 20-57-95]|nr:MAG: hypothetical protein B7Z75_02025 [Acidocella sp. 20-57-95]OYV62513.1 MAG: hypothetical protein B7Z71_00860 [Acidocella sp. 21-58-7]HQT63780.1 M23 family metallopeptidase [Acidocella sp.]